MLQLASVPRVTEIRSLVAWSCFWAAMFASAEATAQLDALNWTSQVIQLPQATADKRPAVATSIALHPEGTTVAIAGDDHIVYI